MKSLISCVSIVSVVVLPFAALGQDRPVNPPAAAVKLTDAEVKSLIEQLGSNKAAERQAAEKKLQAAGPTVFPALIEAAGEGSKTATANIFDILEAHVEGKDKETRLAAFNSLRKLLVGNRPAAASAAKKIMEDHKDLLAQGDAALLAAVPDKPVKPEKKPAPPKANPTPKPAVASDPLTNLRRQALEQQVKDAEAAIEKIKKLDLPKQLKDAQISAATAALQQVRQKLRELDGGPRRK